MSDDERIKSLIVDVIHSMSNDMADRIEELEAKLAEEIEISNQRSNHIEFVLLPQMSDLHFQIKDLQAQLTKAMGALGKVQAFVRELEPYAAQGTTLVPALREACETFIELKGEKDE